VRANVAALPFRDESFDALVAVHIFHLIDRWQDAMDEARRVLRPGGLLLAGTSHHAPDSGARDLRRRLDELGGANESRRVAGLLDWEGVGRELESRFGSPREAITPPWQTHTSPRAVIDAYESRTWSSTWALSDAALTHAAAEARRWAIARWGDLDAPLIEEQRFGWTIYERHV
jgi:SAM-dependent methyltransferase